jgi:hypothetical protein
VKRERPNKTNSSPKSTSLSSIVYRVFYGWPKHYSPISGRFFCTVLRSIISSTRPAYNFNDVFMQRCYRNHLCPQQNFVTTLTIACITSMARTATTTTEFCFLTNTVNVFITFLCHVFFRVLFGSFILSSYP